MSIIIKGLSLPERGCVNVQIWSDGRVNEIRGGREWTAKELPDHGDLIDRDALPKYTGYALSADDVANAVINANAVIPAERSEDGK